MVQLYTNLKVKMCPSIEEVNSVVNLADVHAN
ncbi:hypothetical protein E2C01_011717 [Portunus trituberculatus]|uniref:Uncharacterized protein n=1 Tax=Portunus trituberculatus TaxID=210409 RepID=A0A5B7DBT2_PORTR|nr:hypothetical protein [Portunus trituberculatus]